MVKCMFGCSAALAGLRTMLPPPEHATRSCPSQDWPESLDICLNQSCPQALQGGSGQRPPLRGCKLPQPPKKGRPRMAAKLDSRGRCTDHRMSPGSEFHRLLQAWTTRCAPCGNFAFHMCRGDTLRPLSPETAAPLNPEASILNVASQP